MRVILNPPVPDGIVVVNEGEDAPPNAESVHISSIDLNKLPNFPASALPLPLNHPARVYRSMIPGIRLTHPGGDFEGGAGSSSTASDRADFARELAEDGHIKNAAQFWRVVQQEKRETLKELEEKMTARQEAIKHNEKLESQLDALKEQRDLEVRLWNRARGMGKS
jgi:hypothetical protein